MSHAFASKSIDDPMQISEFGVTIRLLLGIGLTVTVKPLIPPTHVIASIPELQEAL